MLEISSFLPYLFSIAIVFVAIQAEYKQSPPKRDYNLYDDKVDMLSLTNIFRLGGGISNFLRQGQHDLNQEVPETTPEFGDVYDFVIVGAGTAGATVAARLSEIPQIKVLLIEAGSNENLFMDIPIFAFSLQTSSNVNWKYRTKSSNRYCLGMNDNSCNWPAGKVMGGSSVLNYMIATRGSAENFDRWAEMGNEGWAYKDVLKYFKKLETIDIPELRSNTTYHGTEGPLHITHSLYRTPLAEAFLKAGEELKYPLVSDCNGKDVIGFSYVQSTIMNGARMSSNRAYLYPIHDRKNLHVTRNSMVRKVLINHHTKQTVGVEFIKYGRIIQVYASKEVILCAGSVESAQLLMLSGIGPAKHLRELGIDVVRNAPVGENLMDHIFFGLSWTINAPVGIKAQELLNPIYPYMVDFFTRRSGPLTLPVANEAFAFINTKHPEKRSGLSDIELLFSSGDLKGDLLFPFIMNVNSEIRQIWSKYSNKYVWTILSILLKPKSRGRIRLLANDINVKPEIVPNYFDDLEDMETMIAGIKVAISIGQTRAMQEFGSQLLNDTIPGCESYKYDSYAYWECMIRTVSSTLYHYSGTCKMGPRGDTTAVVNPKLKVIDVQGLRVADASIMPEIISAHPNIAVCMIAEKLADMIKEEWGYLRSP
ncbi:glucose dehydrogenase [FAD, quinone]-like [Nylanderia fulva]|uniref:glucose dehydrogenase [FAD, quinone]-like n=1 Tax=Nylanderia fulva TaxID=613905 RepID=UPI0010FB6BAE|nr:glucose dehydrogenase [FAD, quinone]-like [Nylanderia fulva]